jgi:hypothetical protein
MENITPPSTCAHCHRQLKSEIIEGNEECPVCHANFASKILLPCCYRFCPFCLDQWHNDNNNYCITCHNNEEIIIDFPHHSLYHFYLILKIFYLLLISIEGKKFINQFLFLD